MSKKDAILKTMNLEQQQFAYEFMIDYNIRAALHRIGQNPDTDLNEFLGDSRTMDFIDLLKKEQAKNTQISHNEVLNELVALAFTDMKDFIDYSNGQMKVKDLDAMSNTKAIKKIKVQVQKVDGKKIGYITEIELYDKLKALEMLAKHTLFYSDNVASGDAEPMEKGLLGNRVVYINHRVKNEPLEDGIKGGPSSN